jgi:hypothetical protein
MTRMTGERGDRRALVRRAHRGAAVPLLGALLLGAVAAWLPACQQDEDRLGEAMEELKDEAMDAADEVEDEVDDHT